MDAKKRKRRNNSIKDFALFGRICGSMYEEGHFHRIAKQDQRHKNFCENCAFYVAPGGGGGGGGMDEKLVEIYYGSRPIDSNIVMKYSSENRSRLELPMPHMLMTVENGGALKYLLKVDGSVDVIVTPFTIDGYQRHEDGIILQNLKSANLLTGPTILRKHFRFFLSYCSCTNIYGNPCAAEKILVAFKRLTCKTIRGNSVIEERYKLIAKSNAKWFVTIGMSGAAIYLLQKIFFD